MTAEQSTSSLVKILRLIGEGELGSTAEIARRLERSEELVTAMVDDLTRRGYLAPMEAACADTCGGCALASACTAPAAARRAPRLLVLTSRGRAVSGLGPS